MRWIHHIFLILFFAGFSAEAKWSNKACEAYLHSETSLGATFVSLQNHGQLIQQMDPRLAMRALLVPNGGLCVSTCGVNAIRAVYHYATGFGGPVQAFPDEYIHRIVNQVWWQNGHDARFGLFFSQAAVALQSIALQEHLNMVVAWEPIPSRPLTLGTVKPAENELVMIAVETGLKDDGTPAFHAFVVSGMNSESKFLSLSDPYLPNRIFLSAARPVFYRGHWTVRIDVPARRPTEFTGTIVDVLRISVPPLYLPPWQPAY